MLLAIALAAAAAGGGQAAIEVAGPAWDACLRTEAVRIMESEREDSKVVDAAFEACAVQQVALEAAARQRMSELPAEAREQVMAGIKEEARRLLAEYVGTRRPIPGSKT